jgi:hypothetical protein
MTGALVLAGILAIPIAIMVRLAMSWPKPKAAAAAPPKIDRCRHCHGALDEYDSGNVCRWCASDDAREYAGVDR